MGLTTGEVCLRDAELTTAEIAKRCAWSKRTAKRRVREWWTLQKDPTLPRVRRAKAAGSTRWCYLVDAKSLQRFLTVDH